MTPEAQRIAIAEYCGWTKQTCPPLGAIVNPWHAPSGGYHQNCPDYLNDLNAMHEAEIALTPHERIAYVGQLMDNIGCEGEWTTDEDWSLIITDASQRAEAFLRTIGKWVE